MPSVCSGAYFATRDGDWYRCSRSGDNDIVYGKPVKCPACKRPVKIIPLKEFQLDTNTDEPVMESPTDQVADNLNTLAKQFMETQPAGFQAALYAIDEEKGTYFCIGKLAELGKMISEHRESDSVSIVWVE